jgi:Fe2+ or Zn2+ uptake regulation protein
MEVLRTTKSHPTARWVFDRVRREFPNLSLGTVYRNLGILAKQGLVNRLDFGSNQDRFEATILLHQGHRAPGIPRGSPPDTRRASGCTPGKE